MYTDNENTDSVGESGATFPAMGALFLSLIVSCAIMYYVVAPMYKEAGIIKAGNKIKEENVKNDNLALVRIIKINSGSKNLNSESVEKIKDFIPNRNNYEDYLIHIIKLANSKNIEINDFSVSENKNELKASDLKANNGDGLIETEINLAASSGFLNFISFLRSIEKSIPFIQVESVLVSAESEKGEINENSDINAATNMDSILEYEMKLKFYHY